MNDLQARAIKFFRSLAAGAPISNVTWGKSEREIRDFYLLAAQAIESAPEGEVKYIFRTSVMLRQADMEKIRNEIKRQLDEGVLILSAHTSYVGRELEICGHKITVELVEQKGKQKMTGLNELTKAIHENAVAHGWWEEERSFPEIIALVHSELSEALEEYRSGNPVFYMECNVGIECCTIAEYEGRTCPDRSLDDADAGKPCKHRTGKPEGIAVELADAIIRILDYCGFAGIDIEEAIVLKHEYNKSRPYRHGGKKC